MNHHLTTAAIALFAIAAILWLIRKDHLHPRKATWWVALAGGIGLVGAYPGLSDLVARHLGIHYPPSLAFVIGFVVVLWKLLSLDIAHTRERQTVLILSQRISLLEHRVEELAAEAMDATAVSDDRPRAPGARADYGSTK